MTGFIFTCSLLCTAALQADPAVLQRAETNMMRQIFESVMPVLPIHTTGTQRETRRTGFCVPAVQPLTERDEFPRRTIFSHDWGCGCRQFVRMHPIRAPAGATAR